MRDEIGDTISFPRKIYSIQLESLLSHLGTDLQAEVDYTFIKSYRRGYCQLNMG